MRLSQAVAELVEIFYSGGKQTVKASMSKTLGGNAIVSSAVARCTTVKSREINEIRL